VGAVWDHVAPWRSVYKLNQLTNVEVTFALTNSGHNRGIISPPGRADRHFRVGTAPIGSTHIDADQWLGAHVPQNGSWWPSWFDWLGNYSGPPAALLHMGNPKAGFAPGEAALGAFVHG
jgi:polyhydroxyalkanoate synthase subunit PhaC